MPDFERLNDTTDATIRGMWCPARVPISVHFRFRHFDGLISNTLFDTPAQFCNLQILCFQLLFASLFASLLLCFFASCSE